MKEFKYIVGCFLFTVISILLVSYTYPEEILYYTVSSGLILLGLVLWLKITKQQVNFYFVIIYTLISVNLLNLIYMRVDILITVVGYLLGFAISVLISMITNRVQITNKFLKLLVLSFIVVIFIVLLFAPESMISQVNQTRAWLIVGNVTVQLSEFVKPLYIVFCVSVINNEDSSDHRKFCELLFGLIVIAIGFCLISELGTLLLCMITFCVSVYFLPKRYFKTMCYLGMIAIVVGGVSIFLLLKLNDSSFEMMKTVMSLPIHLACKVYDRFYILWNYKFMSEQSYAFQYIRAREALVLASEMPFFRSPITVYIAEYSSDFSFISLVLNCGVLYGFLYLLLVFLLIMWMYRTYINQEISETNQMLRVLVVVLLFSEIWMGIGASTCVLPIIGLGTPFLSKSGTISLLTALLLSGHLYDLKYKVVEE